MNDYGNFRDVARQALVPAAAYINDAIRGKVDLSEYEVKGDKTIVTVVDKESQRISRPIIQEAYPSFRLSQEESKGDTRNLESPIVVYHDPLDGTGNFLVGGSSPTIILGLHDSKAKQILAVATMEPSTGRFWYSVRGEGTKFNFYDYSQGAWGYAEDKAVHVNSQELKGSRLLVDLPGRPFRRKLGDGTKKQILTQLGREELSRRLEYLGAKEACVGSNGAQFAFVAMGRPTLGGCISTAIGGPWDVAGMLHVKEAGGVAKCYGIGDGRDFYELENPEDIASADMVIATNNSENLGKLEEIVRSAVRG